MNNTEHNHLALNMNGSANEFKIDLSCNKKSSDGTIMSKIDNFQNHISIHDAKLLDVYIKSPMISSCGREVLILDRHTNKEKKMLMFGSNSYLDATTLDSAVKKAVEVTQECGIGSGGVPLLSGTTIHQRNLELQIANLKGFEDAMLFSSGFTANLGAISGLMRPNNLLVYDKLNHASLIDGAIMSGTPMMRYRHNDSKSLEKILQENCDDFPGGIMVVTDGVFSMDGDIANLKEIIETTNRYNALLLIDDAHATGMIGKNGAGSLSHWGIKDRDNIIVTGTLSKALGSVGGFITASQKIIDYLRIYARSNMYSTSLPPSVCASVSSVINNMENSDAQSTLMLNSEYLRRELNKMGLNTLNSETAIIPVIVGDEYKLTRMINDFYDKNIFVNYIFPPVVSPRLSRIRISVMSSHTRQDMDYLIESVKSIFEKYDLIR